MQRSLLIIVSSLSLAVAAGCSSTPRAVTPVEQVEWASPAGDKGVQILTPHFDLRITARDPVLREVLPAFMEDAHAAYEKTVPPANDSSERLVVYLFDTRDQWAVFTRGFSPVRADTYMHILSGGYTEYGSATAVVFDLRRDHTLALLAHEGMHQYLARRFPEPVPPWVNEGLATQWEAFDLHGDRPNFTPRKNYGRRNNLRELISVQGGLIPLTELLRMNAGEAVRGVQYASRAYYAQIWSLMLFLQQGPCPQAYHEGFLRLLADVGTDRMRLAVQAQRAATPGGDAVSPGELLFRHYITEDVAAAETEYREFAQALLH